jgi:hypothetical protein
MLLPSLMRLVEPGTLERQLILGFPGAEVGKPAIELLAAMGRVVAHQRNVIGGGIGRDLQAWDDAHGEVVEQAEGVAPAHLRASRRTSLRLFGSGEGTIELALTRGLDISDRG